MLVTKRRQVVLAVIYGIESVLMAIFLYVLTGGMISWVSFAFVVILGVFVKAQSNKNEFADIVVFLSSLIVIYLLSHGNWLVGGLLFLAFVLIGFNFPFKDNR